MIFLNKDLYRFFLLLSLMFIVTIAYAQEDCTNGIDDDGDGLIDLLDLEDCFCGEIIYDEVIGDFEEFSCCPSTNNQGPGDDWCLDDGWLPASAATTDYYNSCDYLGIPGSQMVPLPIPSGEGAIGFNSHEYIGTCLDNTMIEGEIYNLSFYIGFNTLNGSQSDLNITINLYGTEDCSNFPESTIENCFTDFEEWEIMVEVPVSGTENDSWVYVETSFVAPMNAAAIAFGGNCSLPWPQYHFIDDIHITGNYIVPYTPQDLVFSGNCIDGVSVELPISTGIQFQWYLDGVAIPGATSIPYLITNAEAEGAYQVTYIENGLCRVSNPIDIQIETNVIEIEGVISEVQCIINSDAAIDISTNSSNEPFEFEWSNNSLTEDLIDLLPGTYSVTVTDDNGCFGTETFIIEEPLTIEAELSGDCLNGVTISITDIPGYSYQWYLDGNPISDENSSSYQIPSGVMGEYQIVASNGNICTVSTPLFVYTDLDVLEIDGEVVDLLCSGIPTGSIDLEVDDMNPPLTYVWSNGEETEDLSNLGSGTYSVTVIDENGCFGEMEFTIESPPPMTIAAAYEDTVCANLIEVDIVLTVQGGNSPYTYLWNTGSTKDTLFRVGAGLYSVDILDSLGCSAVDTFLIDTFPSIDLQFATTSTGCNEEEDGAINMTISSGIGPFTIWWSNDSITKDLIELGQGWYSVTVTDSIGCIVEDSVQVNANSGIEVIESVNAVNCEGEDNGYISLTISGGQIPYNISWSNGEETIILEDLSPGLYDVTIVDDAGCTWTQNYEILVNSDFNIIAETQNNDCFGSEEGSIELTIAKANSSYSIQWADGSSDENRYGLLADEYSFELIDSFGCVYVDSFIITEGIEITYQSVISEPGCNGATDGLISISPVTGAFPFSYEWSNGDVVNQIIDLSADTYFLTITDDIGCVKVDTFLLSENSSVAVEETTSHNSCYGYNEGTIQINITGGLQPYDIIWSNGETTNLIEELSAGDYYVTVEDLNGCNSSYIYTIVEPDSLHIEDSVELPLCFDDVGTIQLQGVGGTQGYTFLWSTGETNPDIVIIPGVIYSVTMTDANQCIKLKTYIIEEITELEVVATSIIDPSPLNNDGSIIIVISGGTPPYNTTWDHGDTELSIANLGSGSYTANVDDANGCTQTITIELSNDPISVSGMAADNLCYGDCLGRIQLTIEGGTEPYTIMWSDGQLGPNALTLCSGEYQATIIDGIGEEIVSELFVINSPSVIIIDGQAYNISCIDMNDGSIIVNSNGGEGPFGYNWSNAMIGNSIGNLSPGEYSVTVMDNNGCSESSTYSIEDIPLIEIDIETLPFDCENPLSTIIFNGDNIYNYPYLLNGSSIVPNAQNEINDLDPGTYEISYAINPACILPITSLEIEGSQGYDLALNPLTIEAQEGEEVTITLSENQGLGLSNFELKWESQNPYNCIDQACQSITVTCNTEENLELTVIDPWGCEQYFTIPITLLTTIEDFTISNVFSPNGDNVNDQILLLPNIEGLTLLTFNFYDRWGNEVYRYVPGSDPYWNGMLGSQYLSTGVYVYHATYEYNGEIITKYGDITLLR